MKELINYINEVKFGANKKYDNGSLHIVIIRRMDDNDSYWGVFNKKDSIKLLQTNTYSEKEITRLKRIFEISFEERNYSTVLIRPINVKEDWQFPFEFNEDKSTYHNYGYKENTDITIEYKDFNINYWIKQGWE